MKTLLRPLIWWLPLASTLAQTQSYDLDPVLVARSNPYPPRGSVRAVAVQDGIAYCALDWVGLAIFDVHDPAKPSWLAAAKTPGSSLIRRVAVFGAYACTAAAWPADLSIFDVKNPAEPRILSRVSLQGWGAPTSLTVEGRYAYVTLDGGLEVVDLTDPAQPKPLGRLESIGDASGVAVAGDHAYVAFSKQPGRAGVAVINVSDPTRLVRVATYEGPTSAVAVGGTHLLVTDSLASLQVLDISNPAAPQRVSEIPVEGARAVTFSGTHAYVASWKGETMGTVLHAIDLTDPTKPVLVGSTPTGYRLEGITVAAEQLYAACFLGSDPGGDSGLKIFDIRNPAKPHLVGTLGTSGFPYDMVVRGRHAIVAEGWAGLQIIDLSDPNQTRRVGSHLTEGQARRVVLRGDLAYTLAQRWDDAAGRWHASLEIFDLSNVSTPLRLGVFNSQKIASSNNASDWNLDLALSGSYAYLVSGSETVPEVRWLEITDISQPVSPSTVGAVALDGPASAVVIEGTHAYVGIPWVGVELFDVQDPANPKRLSRVDVGDAVHALALVGSHLYVSGEGLTVVDVNDPVKPRILDPSPGAPPPGGRLVVAGTRAYALVGHSVHAVDLSDAAHPRWLGTARLSAQARAAAMLDERLLVIEGNNYPFGPWGITLGLELIDFNRWANPQRIGTYERGWYGRVAVSGDYAYRASGRSIELKRWAVLETVSLRDPAQPTPLGSLEIQISGSGWPSDLAVSGTRAVLATGFSGLQIIDISNPAFPKRLGSINTGRDMERVAVAGDHAFVTENAMGLSVIDASDPANPKRVGGYRTAGRAAQLALAGDLLLVWAEGTNQLHLFDVSVPAVPKRLSTLPLSPLPANGVVSDIAISGHYAFLAIAVRSDYARGSKKEEGLRIVDVSDPVQPRVVGSAVTPPGYEVGVAVTGNYAYLVAGYDPPEDWGGLEIFDVSDPISPRRVGGNSTVRGNSIALYQDRPVVAGAGGLTVLNPFVPLRLGSPHLQQGGLRLSVAGPPGWPVRIQHSADLNTWQGWQTLTLDIAPVELADPEVASQARRFYRAVAP